jgi:hypothetical protein
VIVCLWAFLLHESEFITKYLILAITGHGERNYHELLEGEYQVDLGEAWFRKNLGVSKSSRFLYSLYQ